MIDDMCIHVIALYRLRGYTTWCRYKETYIVDVVVSDFTLYCFFSRACLFYARVCLVYCHLWVFSSTSSVDCGETQFIYCL